MRDNSLQLYVLAVKRQSLNEASHIADIQQYDSLFGDPVGIRTQDPQLRRLLLYPAELPDLTCVIGVQR